MNFIIKNILSSLLMKKLPGLLSAISHNKSRSRVSTPQATHERIFPDDDDDNKWHNEDPNFICVFLSSSSFVCVKLNYNIIVERIERSFSSSWNLWKNKKKNIPQCYVRGKAAWFPV